MRGRGMTQHDHRGHTELGLRWTGVTVTGRPVLVPVPVPVAVAWPVAVAGSVASSGCAELAVVSVAAVGRLTYDGDRVLRLDRPAGQRGMAAAAGTRCRGGDRGQRPCRHCRYRGMRRCRMAPLWSQVRLAGPGLLGRSDERAAPISPGTAGRTGRRRCGARAEVASSSSRLTADNTSGDRHSASYSSTSGPGSAPTAVAMPRMCPRA